MSKTDKGFQLNYWNLSYRRKLIRTFWLLPLIFLFFLRPEGSEIFGLKRNLLITLLFIFWAFQSYYNYFKWKQSEYSQTTNNNEKI